MDDIWREKGRSSNERPKRIRYLMTRENDGIKDYPYIKALKWFLFLFFLLTEPLFYVALALLLLLIMTPFIFAYIAFGWPMWASILFESAFFFPVLVLVVYLIYRSLVKRKALEEEERMLYIWIGQSADNWIKYEREGLDCPEFQQWLSIQRGAKKKT
ncbi:MAG: hypothetical protein ACMUIE_02595 [Thermoplasmatota archaeon]